MPIELLARSPSYIEEVGAKPDFFVVSLVLVIGNNLLYGLDLATTYVLSFPNNSKPTLSKHP